jgi:hypothetical protein
MEAEVVLPADDVARGGGGVVVHRRHDGEQGRRSRVNVMFNIFADSRQFTAKNCVFSKINVINIFWLI